MSVNQKAKELIELYRENSFIERIVAQFLVENRVADVWNIGLNYRDIIDLLWFMPEEFIDIREVQKHTFLKELYSAKGYIKLAKSSAIFELGILISLKESLYDNASLCFEYCCSSCKHTYPVIAYRCHGCSALLSLQVEPILTKKQNEIRGAF
jgi:hypothetical protein